MKTIIIIILAIISHGGICQNADTIFFNRVYNPYNKPNTYSSAVAIQPKGNAYAVISVGDDSIATKENIQVCEIDSAGNLIKLTSYGADSCAYFAGKKGSFVKTHDGGYCLAGSKRYYNGKIDHLMMRFNANLDTLWTKTYAYDNSINEDILYHLCQTPDKGFACVGLRAITTTLWNVLIFKTDSSGNFLWEKSISLGNNCTGKKIMATPDGGLLITGNKFSNNEHNKPFIIKTDSLGNYQWHRILGGYKLNSAAAMAITPQGDYLVAYGYGYNNYSYNEHMDGRLNIIKYSPDGYQLWNKMYDTIRYDYGASRIIMLPNNDFMVVGGNWGNGLIGYSSYFFRFNYNGDSLYRKSLYYSTYNADANLLFENVLNSDGSITACGYVFGDTLNPYNKMWVLRVKFDDTFLGIKEYYQKEGNISVFPNPAADDYITLSYEFAAINNKQLFISDANGRLVYQSKLNANIGQEKISIKDFASGTYICSFYSNGKLLNALKFIKK